MNSLKLVTLIVISAVALYSNTVDAKERTKGRGADGIPVIYVTSQDLFYDTLLLKELPYNGTTNFQKLELTGPYGPQTEFGPTDTGYYGGRWWVDINNDGVMDEEDMYFLCPLLGPGKTM